MQRGAEGLAGLARAYARAGNSAAFDRTMETLRTRRYVSPYTLATIAAAQGHIDEALRLLQKAFDDGVAALPYIGIDPRLDPLRIDVRFAALLTRAGLGPRTNTD